MRRVALALLLLTAVPAVASDVVLTGGEGHPRARFPLAIHVTAFGDAALDAAATRAVNDWNRVTQETLGVSAFAPVESQEAAHVVVDTRRRDERGLMGFARVEVGADRAITLPVRVVVYEPVARGETSRETLLDQVLAHELGHALGLPHNTDPRSLRCCIHESLDFKDPAVRAAYVESRRRPDVGTVKPQLSAHYERVWRVRP